MRKIFEKYPTFCPNFGAMGLKLIKIEANIAKI
jgi:hypothetical protein